MLSGVLLGCVSQCGSYVCLGTWAWGTSGGEFCVDRQDGGGFSIVDVRACENRIGGCLSVKGDHLARFPGGGVIELGRRSGHFYVVGADIA